MVPGVEWDIALTHIREEPKNLAQASQIFAKQPAEGIKRFWRRCTTAA